MLKSIGAFFRKLSPFQSSPKEETIGPNALAKAPRDRKVPKIVPFWSGGPLDEARVVKQGTTVADEKAYSDKDEYKCNWDVASPIKMNDGMIRMIPWRESSKKQGDEHLESFKKVTRAQVGCRTYNNHCLQFFSRSKSSNIPSLQNSHQQTIEKKHFCLLHSVEVEGTFVNHFDLPIMEQEF